MAAPSAVKAPTVPDAKGRGKVVLGKCPSRARIRRCPGDRDPIGEMAERFKAPVLKTGEGLNLPWVRIPLSPPVVSKSPWEQGLFCFYSLRYPPVYPSTCKVGAFDRTRYRSRLSRQISPTTARSSGWLCWTRKRQLACGRVRQGGRCDSVVHSYQHCRHLCLVRPSFEFALLATLPDAGAGGRRNGGLAVCCGLPRGSDRLARGSWVEHVASAQAYSWWRAGWNR